MLLDRGIERAGAGVARRLVALRASTGEENHVVRRGLVTLKTRSVGGENEYGTRGAVTDDANAGPYIDRVREAIAAGRDERRCPGYAFLEQC